jgi:hypothetical protein
LFETTFESLEEKTFFILFIEDEHKETHQKTRTRTDADMFLKNNNTCLGYLQKQYLLLVVTISDYQSQI